MPIVVFERFTGPARRMVVLAQEAARQDRCRQIGTNHLLIALADPIGTDSSVALASLGISEKMVRRRAGRYATKGWRASPAHIPLAPETRRTISGAARESDRRGDVHVRTADLLLGVAAGKHGEGWRILASLGVDYGSLCSALSSATAERPDLQQDVARVALHHSLVADRETVRMYRILHAECPDIFRNDLEKALRGLVTDLDNLGLDGEARQARQDLTALAGDPDQSGQDEGPNRRSRGGAV